jgi:hypothetical protein
MKITITLDDGSKHKIDERFFTDDFKAILYFVKDAPAAQQKQLFEGLCSQTLAGCSDFSAIASLMGRKGGKRGGKSKSEAKRKASSDNAKKLNASPEVRKARSERMKAMWAKKKDQQ